MKKRIVIAIDGPAGSGKSSIARVVAKKLEFLYVDSGAIYRAYTLQCLKEGIDIDDSNDMIGFLKRTAVTVKNHDDAQNIFVNGAEVSNEIRSLQVTAKVSSLSEKEKIREEVTRKLRKIAGDRSVVMEGRDIGMVVFPNADLKVFVTASIEARARRRRKDFELSGVKSDLEQLRNDLAKRDKQDSDRSLAPLQKAPDAIVLDTTDQSLDESVESVVQLALKVLNKTRLAHEAL